jgi:hypothetical protein
MQTFVAPMQSVTIQVPVKVLEVNQACQAKTVHLLAVFSLSKKSIWNSLMTMSMVAPLHLHLTLKWLEYVTEIGMLDIDYESSIEVTYLNSKYTIKSKTFDLVLLGDNDAQVVKRLNSLASLKSR